MDRLYQIFSSQVNFSMEGLSYDETDSMSYHKTCLTLDSSRSFSSSLNPLISHLYMENFKRMDTNVNLCQKILAMPDAEGASSSSKAEIIKGLNEDLTREYKAIIQYVVFSSTLKGVIR